MSRGFTLEKIPALTDHKIDDVQKGLKERLPQKVANNPWL